MKPPPPPTPPSNLGIAFNTSFGDNMVLQQQPAKSCVYGTLGEGGTGASVKISGKSEAGNVVQYDVDATVTDGGSWKACLQPEKAGGLHTITATCTGCINKTAAIIVGATFGDVWYCGGRSFYPCIPPVVSSRSHYLVSSLFLASWTLDPCIGNHFITLCS
jgi:hypothetical protein